MSAYESALHPEGHGFEPYIYVYMLFFLTIILCYQIWQRNSPSSQFLLRSSSRIFSSVVIWWCVFAGSYRLLFLQVRPEVQITYKNMFVLARSLSHSIPKYFRCLFCLGGRWRVYSAVGWLLWLRGWAQSQRLTFGVNLSVDWCDSGLMVIYMCVCVCLWLSQQA